jgi:UDPglucose--hexose-1-phosphate uridylyltransferase
MYGPANMSEPVLWEERWHPLREEWIIVAAHRQSRPWIGATSDHPEPAPHYDPGCYLCPGNARANGVRNPEYSGVFVFDNDYPCVSDAAPETAPAPAALYRNRRADGIARVICYSPRHDRTLPEMSIDQICDVISMWQAQMRELSEKRNVKQVLIFENKGEAVGVSNPHPHGQIYATNFTWKTFDTELAAMRRHMAEDKHGRGLFEAVIEAEQQDGRRVLAENDAAIGFLPYFARYAYEAYIAPKRRVAHVSELTQHEVLALAGTIKTVTARYDNLWQMPFPYVMALHQAPTDGGDYSAYHFHIQFHPPLRRPNLLKFLAGPEIGGGNFLSDTLPEAKAAELLAVPATHYKEGV